MTRIFADDTTDTTPHDDATIFAARPNRRGNFHSEFVPLLDGTGGRRSCSEIIRTKAIDNATFLEIIGRHFHSHAVSRENANLVNAHSSCEMAEELMILGFFGSDTNTEGGIGKAFLNNANEFNDILRHLGSCWNKAGGCYIGRNARASPKVEKTPTEEKNHIEFFQK
jgi:hypothetical protein